MVDSFFNGVRETNRGLMRRFRKAFRKLGLGKIYFKTTEGIVKFAEKIGFLFSYIWSLIVSSTVHSNTATSIREKGGTTAKRKVLRPLKKLFWNYGLAKIYYTTIEGLVKFAEKIAFLCSYIWSLFVTSTVHSDTAASLRKKGEKTAKKVNRSWEDIAHNATKAAEKSIFTAWLVKLFRIVHSIFRTLFGFWIDWLWTRNFWLLMGAIPATVLMLPIVYFLVRIPFQSATAKSNTYQRAVSEAISANNFEAVDLYNRRIAQLGNRTHNKMAYRAALKLEEKNRIDEAYRQMKKLAKPGQPGFLPAHLWIADRLFSKKLKLSSESEANSLIIGHLEQSLALNPKLIRATWVLATTYLAEGDRDKAKMLLDSNQHLYTDPIDQLRVAKLHYEMGDAKTASKYVKKANNAAELREKFGGTRPARHYLGKAEAEIAQGRFDDALQTASTGMSVHPNHSGIANFFVKLKLTRYDRTKSILLPKERLKQLSELQEISANDADVIQRIADLIQFRETEKDVERILVDISKNPDAPLELVFNLLGSAYTLLGRVDEARSAFERVLKVNSAEPDTLNNLSWIYSHHQPIDFDKALAYAQKSVEINPKNPHYRDTLGHVYMQLNRWEEASRELRKAVNGMPDNRSTHSALSECYEQLNQPNLAAQHRRFASE